MSVFFTSDTHFHHKNVCDFENRYTKDLDEMHENMIDKWNSQVGKIDTVYHLGDFSFGGINQWIEVLDRLKGNIVLIKGNHDKSKVVEKVLERGYLSEYHPLGTVMKVDKLFLNLCHYPLMIGERPHHFSVHGHLHSKNTDALNHVNVGVDSTIFQADAETFGKPIPIEELMVELHQRKNIMLEMYNK